MTSALDLRISELLAARLCHELVGPISAIANGVDLVQDEGLDIDLEALALIGDSARRAGSRLQFYRFAYGYGGEGQMAGPPPFELAIGYFRSSRIVCRYGDSVRLLPLAQQRLGCNLLMLGVETLSGGGSLALDVVGSRLRLEAAGEGVSLAREQDAALALKTSISQLSSRTIQGYFTGLLAKAQGCRLVAEAIEPGRLYITLLAPAG